MKIKKENKQTRKRTPPLGALVFLFVCLLFLTSRLPIVSNDSYDSWDCCHSTWIHVSNRKRSSIEYSIGPPMWQPSRTKKRNGKWMDVGAWIIHPCSTPSSIVPPIRVAYASPLPFEWIDRSALKGSIGRFCSTNAGKSIEYTMFDLLRLPTWIHEERR